MRALVSAIAAVGLAVLLGGCLQGGEPIEDQPEALEPAATEPNATDGSQEPATSGGNETATRANRTSDQSTGQPADETPANTSEEPEPEPTRLPGNLSMEGAEVVERSPEEVRFRWEGSIGPAADAALANRTTFDVPAEIPLAINATLTWSDASSLELAVEDEHVDDYCSSSSPAEPGLEGGSESCQVRTFPRSSWDEWAIRVSGEELGTPAPARPANVTVELTIRLAEPWTSPPMEAPEPAQGATSDPGWPTIEDARIRPGVKVGAGGAETNLGTGTFVFSSPDNRTLYLGWVAHGVTGLEPGDTVELPTAGVEATLVYCSWGLIEETVTCPDLNVATHPRAANDLAMLRLPADARSLVHPATPVWGGPTSTASAPARSEALLGFGNTPFRDGGQQGLDALDPMHGVAWSSTSRGMQAYLTPQPIPGDSGSPILTATGGAVGRISAIGPPAIGGSASGPTLDPDEGPTLVSRLDHALAVMEDETALDVELKTWSLFDRPRAGDLVGPAERPGQ